MPIIINTFIKLGFLAHWNKLNWFSLLLKNNKFSNFNELYLE